MDRLVEVEALCRENVVKGHDEQRVADAASSLPKKAMPDRGCGIEIGGRERGKQPDEEVRAIRRPEGAPRPPRGARYARGLLRHVPKRGATRRKCT